MFACPLFHEFHKLNKNAKLKGANMCLMFTDDLKLLVCWNCVVWIRQNNFACEVANFRGSQIKGLYSIWNTGSMNNVTKQTFIITTSFSLKFLKI